MAACDDPKINGALEKILAMPDAKRQVFIQKWTSDLVDKRAPKDLIEAIACLRDDAVAEKAYEVIYQCRR